MDTDLVWSYSAFAGKDVETIHTMPRHRIKVDRLKDSIRKRGILQPLVLQANRLLDGHHRLRAATELGLATVPVRIINKE